MYIYRIWIGKKMKKDYSRGRLKAAGVHLALYLSFMVSPASKFKTSGPKKRKIGYNFDEKSLNFEKFSSNFSQKNTRTKQFNYPPLSSEIKSITIQLTILTNFSKIDENLVKIDKNLVKKEKKKLKYLQYSKL